MLKLRDIRKKRGLTMKQLGEKVGALESSISFYERGIQMPDLGMLKRIADVLNVSTDELLDHNVTDYDDETNDIRERLRSNPEYRTLFEVARNAKPEHIKAAAAMLKALEPEEFSE